MEPKQMYYAKRGACLVKHLQDRHFEAYYCEDKASALTKALALIPEGASVGWGGAMSAQQIGLMDAVRAGNRPGAVQNTPGKRAGSPGNHVLRCVPDRCQRVKSGWPNGQYRWHR